MTKILDIKTNLIVNWFESGLKNEPISAFYDMHLAPLLLSDVAVYIYRLIEQDCSGIYQLSGTEDISYYEFARLMIKHMKSDSEIIPISKEDIIDYYVPRYTSLQNSLENELIKTVNQVAQRLVEELFKTYAS